MSRPFVVALVVFLLACRAPAPPAPRPPASTPRALPADIAASVTRLDDALAAAWREAGVKPAPPVDDATFLRRVYLDLTGTLPPPDEARSFLSSAADDKRSALVRRLVQTPAFARHFTNYWDAVLMDGARGAYIDRAAFRQWLYRELAQATGWNELVYRLLTASGVNSEGGARDPSRWEPGAPPAAGVNGAVNWLLRGAREPQNLAGAASRIFLGVQIQCAECHDHPTERWTQQDFRSFTAAFMRIGGERLDRGRVGGLRRVSVHDVERATKRSERRMRRTGYDDGNPRALDGTSLAGERPRRELAAWLTAPDNPWFARALVNRLWASLSGGGFVEPVDDLRSDSPVRAPRAFDALAADFVAHDFDLRRLVRVICASAAYQRSAGEAKLWESFRPRPMNADQLLDSLVAASGVEPLLQETVGERLPALKLRLRRELHFVFDVDEESTGADAFTGTVSQALMLLNGAVTNAGSAALAGTTLDRARARDDRDAIEALYLAAYARLPERDELAHWRQHLRNAVEAGPVSLGGPLRRAVHGRRLTPRDAALEDMFWALLVSSEFFFIH